METGSLNIQAASNHHIKLRPFQWNLTFIVELKRSKSRTSYTDHPKNECKYPKVTRAPKITHFCLPPRGNTTISQAQTERVVGYVVVSHRLVAQETRRFVWTTRRVGWRTPPTWKQVDRKPGGASHLGESGASWPG